MPVAGLKSKGVEGMSDAPFYNIDNPVGRIIRTLAEGSDTNISVGDGAMVSLVEAGPNTKVSIHSYLEEHWGVLLNGSAIWIQDGVEHEVRRVIPGARRVVSNTD